MPDALAYFVTFRTYGTFLPGDPRGAVDRRHNAYGTPRMSADVWREHQAQARQAKDAVELDLASRAAVDAAIRAVCAHRHWHVHALNVRSNHVHAVVAGEASPERMMNDFKAYSTRALRCTGRVSAEARVWERHGSTRHLYEADALVSAVDYVMNRQ